MAIIRKDSVETTVAPSFYPAPYDLGPGNQSYARLSDAGGLTQFGALLETLHPGGQSSQMHWEDREDEFLFMLEGEVTVIEDGVPTIIGPGDACCWKAGSQVAHCLRNHTDRDARYLIVGTRDRANTTHYPGLDMLATADGYTHLDGSPYTKKAL